MQDSSRQPAFPYPHTKIFLKTALFAFLFQDLDISSVSSSDSDALSDSLSSAESDDSQSEEAEVTICELRKLLENGETLTLYHLIAGKLDDSLKCGDNPLDINSWHIKDRQLYDFIEDQCEQDLLKAQVSSGKISKLLCEGPSYVITSHKPEKDDKKCSIITIEPELSMENGMDVYEYYHPADRELKIRIHEPMSPPRVEYVCDETVRGSSSISRDVSVEYIAYIQ